MTFDSAQTTWTLVYQMLTGDFARGQNRARINDLFNSLPPLTEEEKNEAKIETNISWGEASRIAYQARNAFSNAILKPATYFSASYIYGNDEQRKADVSSIVSREINRTMKRCQTFRSAMVGRFAQLVLHGISPMTWLRDDEWCPKLRGVEDLLVPTGTLSDFSNLDFYAVYTLFTQAQLEEMTSGQTVDPGWNVPYVKKVIAYLKTVQGTLTAGDQYTTSYRFPERWNQNLQEKSTMWGADSTPTARMFDVYFKKQIKGKEIWCRRIVMDYGSDAMADALGTEFLFDSGDRSYGESIEQILHVQYADGSNVAPFRYHNVRSLGFLLYGPCQFLNRYRCRLTDAAFEALNWYFRIQASAESERVQSLNLFNMSVIPDGVTVVPQNERQQINWQVADGMQSMFKQIIGEHSASYVQLDNNGNNAQREVTATEVVAQVQQSSALLSAMLSEAYQQLVPLYREILRRFFVSDHDDCAKFRRRCEEQGVDPATWKHWEEFDVEPTMVNGSGNKMLEVSLGKALMEVRAALNPEGQREVLHRYVQALSDDPQFANRVVPLNATPPSDSAMIAATQWGTLMTGMPVLLADDINRIDWCNTLLTMLHSKLVQIQQQGGMSDNATIMGLANVINTIANQVQLIEQDPAEKEWAKQASDLIAQASNMVKALMQRAHQAAQAQQSKQGDDGAQQAKMAEAQANIAIKQAEAKQKMEHSDALFAQKLQHEQLKTRTEIATDVAKADAQTHITGIQAINSAITKTSGE